MKTLLPLPLVLARLRLLGSVTAERAVPNKQAFHTVTAYWGGGGGGCVSRLYASVYDFRQDGIIFLFFFFLFVFV